MDVSKKTASNNQNFAIRFGLGAIKSVGFQMMEDATNERRQKGKFKDIYDYAKRLDAKSINKKSIEALSKSGAFDSITNNRRQIAESFDILSNYANQSKEEANSNQMSLFGLIEEKEHLPALKNVSDWNYKQKLNFEFEAFGFFLNEHPLDKKITELKKRGVIFSSKIEDDSLEDSTIVKMAGVVASSKHRSGSKGRFAYINLSDPFGIFEATIFDENLITANRDLLEDGCEIVVECLIKKDDGGNRIMIKGVHPIDDFIKNIKESEKEFEDIKKLAPPKNFNKNLNKNSYDNNVKFEGNKNSPQPAKASHNQVLPTTNNNPRTFKHLAKIEIKILDEKAILPLKTVLMQKISVLPNASQIFLNVEENGKLFRIELAHKYLLEEIDLFRLKNLNRSLQIIN